MLKEVVKDPAALQSPTNSADDTDWKRHSAGHTERRHRLAHASNAKPSAATFMLARGPSHSAIPSDDVGPGEWVTPLTV